MIQINNRVEVRNTTTGLTLQCERSWDGWRYRTAGILVLSEASKCKWSDWVELKARNFPAAKFILAMDNRFSLTDLPEIIRALKSLQHVSDLELV